MFKFKKELMREIQRLKAENDKLQQENSSLLKNREFNCELYNMVKAILRQLRLNEIEIDIETIREVEGLEIYVEASFMKFAKRIKLIDKNKIQKIDNFKED